MDNSILARNVLLLGALDALGAAAAEKSLSFIALKGAALLAEGIWPPGEREMTDLDILIQPGDELLFDALLKAEGFKAMENSSQAYYRMAGPSAPPVIIDLHTGLWHEQNTQALWRRARSLTVHGPVAVKGLGFEDQLLHLASHSLLNHGCLPQRTLDDIGLFLKFVYAKTGRSAFWLEAAGIAAGENLEGVIYPVLKRFSISKPALLSESELSAFAPRGADRLKSLFFEKAAVRHSRILEYFLPVLYRPGLFISYLFPGKSFLERRYGKASAMNRLTRPFRLLAAPFIKND